MYASDKFKSMEHFVHFFLENVREITKPHCQEFVHQTYRLEANRHTGSWNPGEGIGRHPPEESAGGVHRTDNR